MLLLSRGNYLKYSLIAKKYLEELDRKDPSIQHKIITWGNFEMMEDLFKLFGGDREDIINKQIILDIIFGLSLLCIGWIEKAKKCNI